MILIKDLIIKETHNMLKIDSTVNPCIPRYLDMSIDLEKVDGRLNDVIDDITEMVWFYRRDIVLLSDDSSWSLRVLLYDGKTRVETNLLPESIIPPMRPYMEAL